ncbi:hypothetical protein FB459_2034 [Yimella lutea]|uniref:Uncharacterized protein n=1 Tax=Yimella lutea TaxID=587872 RepID=A0A542EGV4_9MICO|nr:hypothetical protein FB459_2034 [Yimella lutea]
MSTADCDRTYMAAVSLIGACEGSPGAEGVISGSPTGHCDRFDDALETITQAFARIRAETAQPTEGDCP